MIVHFFILLISLFFLVMSADKFVLGASSIARNIGVSPLVIGLTIVAMGSSAPEMMVAATASLENKPDTAIGNAIGSNITNIALVLGLTALLKPLIVSSSMIKKEIPLMLVVSVIAYAMLSDKQFTQLEGISLMVGFILFLSFLLFFALKQRAQVKQENTADDLLIVEAELDVPEQTNTATALFWLTFGIIVLPLSANYLVDASVFFAKSFGISDLVIGLTIIAIGTSLPELAASLMSIYKKEDDLAIGNIIGSNIFNILAVMSIPGIISPGAIDPEAVSRDAPYMLFVTLLLLILCFSRRLGSFRITRLKGALLVVSFIGYQYLLFGA